MSIYENFWACVQRIYSELPQLTLGAAASAALCEAANRYTPYTLFNPMDAAKFTGTADLAYIIFEALTTKEYFFSLETRKNSPLLSLASKITFGGLLAYGVNSITNPDKTIASFALRTVQAVGSLVLAKIVVKPFVPEDSGDTNIFSLNRTGYLMIASLYQNGPRTITAAGSAWLAARSFSRLGLDPKITLVFTAATSLLYYATKPLFLKLEPGSEHYLSRALCLLSFTKTTADKLMLNLPLYKEFAKACAVAGTLITIFDNFDKVGPFISGFISGSEKPDQPNDDVEEILTSDLEVTDSEEDNISNQPAPPISQDQQAKQKSSRFNLKNFIKQKLLTKKPSKKE